MATLRVLKGDWGMFGADALKPGDTISDEYIPESFREALIAAGKAELVEEEPTPQKAGKAAAKPAKGDD